MKLFYWRLICYHCHAPIAITKTPQAPGTIVDADNMNFDEAYGNQKFINGDELICPNGHTRAVIHQSAEVL